MLLTVREFRQKVDSELGALADQLAVLTGRGGDSERHAWNKSLPKLADALTHPSLDAIHIHFAKREMNLVLEYQLPGTAAWCDVVLLGRHGGRASAVVIELKDWDTRTDRPGVAEGLIERRGSQELHPSDQVKGYADYCQNFHSAVLDSHAVVHGFVLLTSGTLKHAYVVSPNEELAKLFPVFTMATTDVSANLPSYLSSRLSECDPVFAANFSDGTYRQDRGFLAQIGGALLDSKEPHFVLLNNQRRALHLCLALTREMAAGLSTSKRVLVVEGPPGSGKSAIAAQLWAELVADSSIPKGNISLVTTSQSQSSNWTYLIDKVARNRIGRGVARKATSFSPIDIPRLSEIRRATGDPELYKSAMQWRDHLNDMQLRGIPFRQPADTDSQLISLVDEAHALINTEREHGVGQYGFVTGLGPQAYHIIRCSRVSVFFIDSAQSFRSRENTTIDDLRDWAKDLGASFEIVSLKGAQFRCAGSAEYVAWIESLLDGASQARNQVYASAWHAPARATVSVGNIIAFPVRTGVVNEVAGVLRVAESSANYRVAPLGVTSLSMDFRVFSNPFEMEAELRELAARFRVRLLSTYSRRWKSASAGNPHELPPEEMDFHEEAFDFNGQHRYWSRPWNFVPSGDYTGFVAGRLGLPIHDDPLCEVGCTYAVRGFDFDYVGLLWMDDLIWREGKWMVDLDHVHESGIGLQVRQARKEGRLAPAGQKGELVIERVLRAYRILLTRSIKGTFVWVPDEQTRMHIERSLGK